MNKYDNIVIDDLRFDNELLELKKYNFTIIKLNINYNLQINRYLKLYNRSSINRLNHFSENEQDYFSSNLIDYEFNSDDKLLENIDKLFQN